MITPEIEQRIDVLLADLDELHRDSYTVVNRVIRALESHGELTWHALMQYTGLMANELFEALGILTLDYKRVVVKKERAARVYCLVEGV